MKPLDIFLTKEAFEQYATRLREQQAKEYGMTLEEWDQAVLEGKLVEKINHNTQYNGPTGSLDII